SFLLGAACRGADVVIPVGAGEPRGSIGTALCEWQGTCRKVLSSCNILLRPRASDSNRNTAARYHGVCMIFPAPRAVLALRFLLVSIVCARSVAAMPLPSNKAPRRMEPPRPGPPPIAGGRLGFARPLRPPPPP